MKKNIFLSMIIFLVSSFGFYSCTPEKEEASELSQKEALSAGFPRTLFFRGDKYASDKDYEHWENAHIQYNGVTKKYLTEEVDMEPRVAEFANRFAEEHPEKLMLVHLNGEQIVNKRKDVHEKYFPGHWIYEEGTSLEEDIQSSDTILTLGSAQAFEEEAYVVRGGGRAVGTLPHDILIIKMDEQGNRLWDESEYATVKKVDYENNAITVERGRYFSTPAAFLKGSTYVAPIAGNGWAGNLLWYYNLSSECPKDKNGNTAADVFLEEIKGWFSENGELRNLDGIGFDVCYFSAAHHSNWDTNNDGIADKGIIDGRNTWRIGNWNFMKELRSSFGSEFIITADGWRDEMQRAVGALNGMESEGLCRYNDGFRQISRTLNQHTYWNLHNSTKYKFSYITSKLRNPVDQEISTQLRRMGMGVACGLGVAYTTGNQAEVYGGNLNERNWMGQPVSELKYMAKDSPDLFNGTGISMSDEFIDQFDLEDKDYRVEENTLFIKGTDEKPYIDMSIEGPEIMLPEGGDLIVFFEVKALKGFHDLEGPNRVPRKINIKVNGTPVSTLPGETPQDIEMHNDLAGFMGTPGFTPVNFYFRNIGHADEPVKIKLEVEEQGEFAIRNFTAHNAPCIMAREFENAVVLINPSYDEHNFDLKKIFPELNGLRRIKADERDQSGSRNYQKVLSYNNGHKIDDLTAVKVPGLNALFLLKE